MYFSSSIPFPFPAQGINIRLTLITRVIFKKTHVISVGLK